VERPVDASQWVIGPDQVYSHDRPDLHVDQHGVVGLVAPSIAKDHESVPLDRDGYGAAWQMPYGMEPCSAAAVPWGVWSHGFAGYGHCPLSVLALAPLDGP
jgi:hypothetical protein